MAKGGFSKAEGGKKSKQFAVAGWKGEGAKQGEDCIEESGVLEPARNLGIGH